MADPTRLFTIPGWPHQWPTAAGLRWLIFNEKHNGATAWIRRVGRRVLIDEAAFFDWVDRQSETQR